MQIRPFLEADEDALVALWRAKVNRLVRTADVGVIESYRRLGYLQDAAIPLGKRLIPDGPAP